VAPFAPAGDQPRAIEQLTENLLAGVPHQVLLGVTGSGKTFTMANVIQRMNDAVGPRPVLVMAHNKTLAAQLCSEFRDFFPNNSVEYFVSYYDYYQPEAYLPQTDIYIEKESSINDEIDRLRHAATQAVSERRDVIVVASVSCIYGLGSPELYQETTIDLRVGGRFDRRALLTKLVAMQFTRNDLTLSRGTFRVRGDVLELHPKDEEIVTRVDFFDDEIERIMLINPLTGEIVENRTRHLVYPATHFIANEERLERAIRQIETELDERLQQLYRETKLLEAQRLEQRTKYDLEMMREVGYCNGIENYSRHLDGRQPGQPPFTLLDYFPRDFLFIIDESHQSIPQVHGMWAGDKARKDNLVGFGFRLPSAYDNRPLRFEEFITRLNQVVYVSATPAQYEQGLARQTGPHAIVQQIVRPTGLVDPTIEVRPTRHQIDDLLHELRATIERGERVLITTLTKRMAEDLTDYLLDLELRVHYLHSDIVTLERMEILHDLRAGKYDVVVGINLLREGLDLPEVSLIAILDADKEGYLRSSNSLIQTIGRAARNVNGRVLMYADRVTGSMQQAMDETNRRREIQQAHNAAQGITPQSVKKALRQTTALRAVAEERAEYLVRHQTPGAADDLTLVIKDLEKAMYAAAEALDFERAADFRDELQRMRDLPMRNTANS